MVSCMPRSKSLARALAIALPALSACGVASVSPIVTEDDAVIDPRLTGTWKAEEDKDSAVITIAGPNVYRIVYADGDGKTGRFDARLGTLGKRRVLDVQPVDPLPDASDLYKSLILRAHGLVVIDSLGTSLVFHLVDPDSLKADLKRRPTATPHTFIEDSALLTGSSEEVRAYFDALLARPGTLGDANTWRKRSP